MNRQVCPLHVDEDILGVRLGDEAGWSFTCPRTSGHPSAGPYRWLQAPEPPVMAGMSGLAEDLGLAAALPAALAEFPGRWVEYGVVERAYATANPVDFAFLVRRYGHTAVKPAQYTASAFLASTLGHLGRQGVVLFHEGSATGRWSYDGLISWWSLPPAPDWAQRTSWAEIAHGMGHVPGNREGVQLALDS